MDNEKIKNAFNAFVEDDYIKSKEILNQEFLKKKNEYLKDKLSLEKDVYQFEEEDDASDENISDNDEE